MSAEPRSTDDAVVPVDVDSIHVQRALEQLRQERETFDQRKRHDERWFRLKLGIGVVGVLVIPVVVVECIWLLADQDQSATVKSIAASTLLVDVVALAGATWKIALNPASMTKLAPVTTTEDREGPGASANESTIGE